MRGPPRVRDAQLNRRRTGVLEAPLLELVDLADRLMDVEPAVRHQRDARGVVPTVLETPEPFEQQRDGLPPAGVAHNAAHGGTLATRDQKSKENPDLNRPGLGRVLR